MNSKRLIRKLLTQTNTLTFAISLYKKYSHRKVHLISHKESDLVIWKSKSDKQTIFVNISSLLVKDHGGGIQRVQRALVENWEINPPEKFKISPINFSERDKKFLYVNKKDFLNDNEYQNYDHEIVRMSPGDVYLNLDLDYRFALENEIFYKSLEKKNIQKFTVIYDLLPIQFPEKFPEGIHELHLNWFSIACKKSQLLCISKTVEANVIDWGLRNGLSPVTSTITLGSQFLLNLKPIEGNRSRNSVEAPLNFLVVSTIEVRKCHELVLNAFDILWREGSDVTLTFVGQKGWKVENFIARMESHEQLGKKFFWFNQLNDNDLEIVYRRSTALINASLGEGFGLPLVEASYLGLPLILRDIEIFREVAGPDARYFSSDDPRDLSVTLKDWIEDFLNGKIYACKSVGVTTWKDTCSQIIEIVEKSGSVGGSVL